MLYYQDFKRFEGYFLNEEIAQDLAINNFEYEKKYVQTKTAEKTAFLSISKDRRSEINGRLVNWPDGNEIAKQYHENLQLIITEEPIQELKDKVPQYIVENTWSFMLSLGRYLCENRASKVIATTGSVGKSSTRLMFDHVFSEEAVLSNRGNHNTRFAIPLYLTKMAKDPTIVNLEVSLNALNNRHPGPLTQIIQPDIAILTSVGAAHLATFTSLEHLAEYKARIFLGLKKNGLAIIDRDIPKKSFTIAYQQAKKQTDNIKTYSMETSLADISLVCCKELKHTTEVTINFMNNNYTYFLGTASKGMIENSLAVILAAHEMGYSIEAIIKKFADFKSLPKVMERIEYSSDKGQLTVIDDTHNASIPAMINAIQSFKEKSIYYNGKKLLVLGQVADLGKEAGRLHQSLIPEIENANADILIGYGDLMKPVVQAISIKSIWYESLPNLLQGILQELDDQSLILLKGSISHSDFFKISSLLSKRLTRIHD